MSYLFIYFHKAVLVALSDLDENKCAKVLKWKADTISNHNFTPNVIIDKPKPPVVVSEFGDLMVTKIRKPAKRLSKEELAQITKEYLNGAVLSELAKKYGCSREALSNNLKRRNVNVTKDKAFQKINVKQVLEMYANFETSYQIAGKFGVSRQVITKCLRNNDVFLRKRWDY